MIENDFLEQWQQWLKDHQWFMEDGEEFSQPPLEVLAFGVKPIRLSRLPLFGRGYAVVALTRHPIDLKSDEIGLKSWVERLSKAINGRILPWKTWRPGAVLMIAVQLTPEPIKGEEEERFKKVLGHWTGTRVVPAGIVRVNLGQMAMSSLMADGLTRDLPELAKLIDTWSNQFQRFVPMWSETENI